MSDTDPEARQVDLNAAAELVSRHEIAVRCYAAKIAPRPDMAEDIAQEAFLECLKSIDRFDASGEFGLWMRGIVRNVARRAWTKLYREHRLLKDGLAEHIERIAESARDKNETQGSRDRLSALRRCLEKLPQKSSELVKLRYTLGIRCAEVARKVGTSVNAVKMALVRVRQSLRKCVEMSLRSEGSV